MQQLENLKKKYALEWVQKEGVLRRFSDNNHTNYVVSEETPSCVKVTVFYGFNRDKLDFPEGYHVSWITLKTAEIEKGYYGEKSVEPCIEFSLSLPKDKLAIDFRRELLTI